MEAFAPLNMISSLLCHSITLWWIAWSCRIHGLKRGPNNSDHVRVGRWHNRNFFFLNCHSNTYANQQLGSKMLRSEARNSGPCIEPWKKNKVKLPKKFGLFGHVGSPKVVTGVSPRSRLVTVGHGWSRVGSFIFSIGCFSPVTGGHGSVPVYLVLGVYPRSRLVTGGHGLFLKRNTKQF